MDFSVLDAFIEKYKPQRGSLITILQEAQRIFGYLPVQLIEYIALKTGEKPAKIQGVATFYTQFRSQPVGKYLIMLCQGTACHVNGANVLYEALSNELGVSDGGTTKDGLFTLSTVACLGCCSLSPAMMINEKTYGKLTAETAVAAVRAIMGAEK
ncbi:MAG: NADH-quinone oxidoreductase subunit NuoE [Firmicutes bacterium]|nr:NADH-quinone oxidoreductase subunit NuoE [Bacillota bacterium]